MRKSMALLMALALLLSGIPALAEDAQEPVTITIFHTNDVHARYNSDAGMGYAMMASYINEARSKGDVIVLDAGDTLHGTIFANAVEGSSIVEIMNTIGYDAMTPGNHDYNYGYDRLKELGGMMEFPLVTANIKLADGADAFDAYTILEVAGKKIGVVGASNPEMKSAIHPDHVAKLDFQGLEPVEAAVQELNGTVDAIIVLCHWGCDDAYDPNSVKALAAIPGVSLVIDGHSHTELYDIQQAPEGEGALVTSTGEYLNNLGKVTMTFSDEGLLVEAELVPNPGRFEDHGIINSIEVIEEGQSAVLDEVVGETSVRLEGEREMVRTTESNWGNLATDIFIEATGADVALMNGGNIRATVEAGPLTVRDVNTVFPFSNIVVTQRVSGQALLDALEVGFSLYPETNGGFPQVGGMTVTFDPLKDPGERVTVVHINGELLDPEATYTLATNDFLAAGGDNYASLAEYPVEMYIGTMDEVIVNYLKENSPVAPEVEGRITLADGEAAEEEANAPDVEDAA